MRCFTSKLGNQPHTRTYGKGQERMHITLFPVWLFVIDFSIPGGHEVPQMEANQVTNVSQHHSTSIVCKYVRV